MKSSIISSLIIIIIIVAVAYVGFKVVLGKGGLVEQYDQADYEYNKSEILDRLNGIIKEKYVLDYKYALENSKDINEIYSEDIVFQYLLDSEYIEPLKDIKDNLVEDQYFIKYDSLYTDDATNALKENGSLGNGTKIFKIKKEDNKYTIIYIDKYGEEEEIGELNLKPEI